MSLKPFPVLTLNCHSNRYPFLGLHGEGKVKKLFFSICYPYPPPLRPLGMGLAFSVARKCTASRGELPRMTMRYFTLSAVCMLVFCMLLALSGTTDFPPPPGEMVPPADTAPSAPGPIHSAVGEAVASVFPLPENSEPQTGVEGSRMTGLGVPGNRPLLFLGVLLVVAWVLLSFRLLSHSRNGFPPRRNPSPTSARPSLSSDTPSSGQTGRYPLSADSAQPFGRRES